MIHWKYPSIERLERLEPHPSVVLRQNLWYVIKYDGSCTCVWYNDELDKVMLSSRNLPNAAKDIRASFERTKEYPKLLEMLQEHPTLFLFGELLIKGKSPTRIENHKRDRWIGFDIIDPACIKLIQPANPRGFLTIPYTYQLYYHFKIPTPNVWAEGKFESLDDLFAFDKEILKLVKKRRREGVVAKTVNGIFRWKVKADYPKRRKKVEFLDRPILDFLPDSEAYGAVDKVFADIGFPKFGNPAKAMPLIAEAIQLEMIKHNYGKPRQNFFRYYQNYLDDKRSVS